MENHFYFANRVHLTRFVNRWDVLLLLLLFSIFFFLAWAGKQMATPYELGAPLSITLSPKQLPFYAIRTVLRMFIAMGFSVIATFIIGAWAAKSRRAEQIIIPAIDILQSVPVLSFLAITVTGFIHLFPNSLLGPECAAIFAIFTAQVWNMVFGFYQSLKMVPFDLQEVAIMFQLSSWQKFWKVEAPYAMSSLLWNMMISMSASWFFVVLAEAISVSHQEIRLPGVGSYIALAIEQHNIHALGYAIITMLIVIFLYDQILFRPLIAWSEKFKTEHSEDDDPACSWLIDWARRSQLLKRFGKKIAGFRDVLINLPQFKGRPYQFKDMSSQKQKHLDILLNIIIGIVIVSGSYFLYQFIRHELTGKQIIYVAGLGAITGLRIIILIVFSSLLWIPVGVWVGMRPRISHKIQPIIQFAAAFPANLFYPLFVIAIVTFHLNVEIWITPLMILGTQWYILFNVIAGASMIPRDLNLVADNFGLKGWYWWKRLALPAIFPYYITGAITAAGGAWNASIVAEWVSWGQTTLKATGLGEYIQASTIAGDFPKIALGTAMMCLYVLLFNHVIWRPLYRAAIERFHVH